MTTISSCADCGKEEERGSAVALKRVSLVGSSSIATPNAKGSIGQNIRKNANDEQPSYLRDEALFKDPPVKEDCPICFLPMPKNLICCVSLPPATQ